MATLKITEFFLIVLGSVSILTAGVVYSIKKTIKKKKRQTI